MTTPRVRIKTEDWERLSDIARQLKATPRTLFCFLIESQQVLNVPEDIVGNIRYEEGGYTWVQVTVRTRDMLRDLLGLFPHVRLQELTTYLVRECIPRLIYTPDSIRGLKEFQEVQRRGATRKSLPIGDVTLQKLRALKRDRDIPMSTFVSAAIRAWSMQDLIELLKASDLSDTALFEDWSPEYKTVGVRPEEYALVKEVSDEMAQGLGRVTSLIVEVALEDFKLPRSNITEQLEKLLLGDDE